MTVGDRGARSHKDQVVQRQRLRVRTIAVSFAAAVTSAHRDLETTPGERDALIEVWRAWSLDTLGRYRAELAALDPDGSDPEVQGAIAQLDEAAETVRRR